MAQAEQVEKDEKIRDIFTADSDSGFKEGPPPDGTPLKPVESKPKMYTVFDTNCVDEKKGRLHPIPVGVSRSGQLQQKGYALFSEQPTEMPPEHAMVFCLADPSFVVLDENGERVIPAHIRKVSPGDKIELEQGEVIAVYDELTDDSLFKRCKARPTAFEISVTSSRSAMIAFLENAEQKQAGVSRGSEDRIEELSATDLDNLIPRSALLKEVVR